MRESSLPGMTRTLCRLVSIAAGLHGGLNRHELHRERCEATSWPAAGTMLSPLTQHLWLHLRGCCRWVEMAEPSAASEPCCCWRGAPRGVVGCTPGRDVVCGTSSAEARRRRGRWLERGREPMPIIEAERGDGSKPGACRPSAAAGVMACRRRRIT